MQSPLDILAQAATTPLETDGKSTLSSSMNIRVLNIGEYSGKADSKVPLSIFYNSAANVGYYKLTDLQNLFPSTKNTLVPSLTDATGTYYVDASTLKTSTDKTLATLGDYNFDQILSGEADSIFSSISSLELIKPFTISSTFFEITQTLQRLTTSPEPEAKNDALSSEDTDTPAPEKRKRKRLSINTSLGPTGTPIFSDSPASTNTPEEGKSKRKLSEKRGSIHSLTIFTPCASQNSASAPNSAPASQQSAPQPAQQPVQQLAQQPAQVPQPEKTTLPSISSSQPSLPPFSPQQYKFRPRMPPPPSPSHHQHTMPSPHPHTLPSRSAFLQPYENFYDMLEESAQLNAKLKDMVKKSTVLLSTLQASGSMIEGLVRNHFGVMQSVYGEKFGAALTVLNKRLLKIEEAMKNQQAVTNGGENHTNPDTKDEKTAAQLMNGPLTAGPLTAGIGPFSASGRFHPGPLTAAVNGGMFGGVAEQMLKSVLDRLEAVEKKVGMHD